MNKKYFLIILIIIAAPVFIYWQYIVEDFPEYSLEARNFAFHLNDESLGEIIERAGKADFVLLGESTHGTSEFYSLRAEISKRLIKEQGFDFIAVEGDWPYLYNVNRYIKNLPEGSASGQTALQSSSRWPDWMWANEEFLELVEWLREYNSALPTDKRVGIYGMDMQNTQGSIDALITKLREKNRPLSAQIENALECFEQWDYDFIAYARAIAIGMSCEEEVNEALSLFSSKYLPQETMQSRELFNIEQNLLSVLYGEKYWRSLVAGGSLGWNIRVEYMKDSVQRLTDFYTLNNSPASPNAKGIVWAHNTHIGDARATEMMDQGIVNIGQLMRSKYGKDRVFLLGFSTFTGQVVAGRDWGASRVIMNVPASPEGSAEYFLEKVGMDDFIIFFDDSDEAGIMMEPVGHRAIGVVYNPEIENPGNYVQTVLPLRYDALIFIRETSAVKPI